MEAVWPEPRFRLKLLAGKLQTSLLAESLQVLMMGQKFVWIPAQKQKQLIA
jgi:hypothetical protein